MMKPSVRAALLSGLVFPGIGQFYLKEYRRGIAIFVPVFIALCIVVVATVRSALEIVSRIQDPEMSGDVQGILGLATSHSNEHALFLNLASLVIACGWLFSIIDAYYRGKRKIQNDKVDQQINK